MVQILDNFKVDFSADGNVLDIPFGDKFMAFISLGDRLFIKCQTINKTVRFYELVADKDPRGKFKGFNFVMIKRSNNDKR